MAIPKGNKLWKIQSKYTKDILLESPDLLLEAAFEYFEWCDKHPLSKSEAVKSGAECGRIIDIPLRRPYSLSGLCTYIGCSTHHFEQVRSGTKTLIGETVARIEDMIRTQLFEGATTGIFNTSIVSKWIGDASPEKEDVSGGGSVLHIEVLDEQAKEQLLLLKDRLAV